MSGRGVNSDVRAKLALLWSSADSLAHQLLQLVVGVVLARILLPEDFGLMAMLSIVLAFCNTLVTGGFAAALIQKPNLAPEDASSALLANLGTAVLLTFLLILLAPVIASLYGEARLEPLAKALSASFLLTAVATVQHAQLSRDLNFKHLGAANLSALLAGGALGIFMAVKGFGVWSLAAQMLGNQLLRAVLLWWLSPWRPHLVFRAESLRGLFNFGFRLMLGGLINQVGTNLYSAVIGRHYGALDAGLYSRASQLQGVPSRVLGRAFSRVTFPMFAAIQSDPGALRTNLEQTLVLASFVTTPALAVLAVVAEPVIVLLLTEKWVGAVPLLQMLCVAGMLYPLHLVNVSFLMGTGRSDLFLRLEVIKFLLAVGVLATTWSFGVAAIVLGQVGVSFLSLYVNAYYTRALIGFGIRSQARKVFPYFAAAGLMAFVLALPVWPSDHWGALAAKLPAGAILYFACCGATRTHGARLFWNLLKTPLRLARDGFDRTA